MKATVTDLELFVRILEHLHATTTDPSTKARLTALGELVVLDIDITTLYRRLARGMPDNLARLDVAYQALGWTEELHGY